MILFPFSFHSGPGRDGTVEKTDQDALLKRISVWFSSHFPYDLKLIQTGHSLPMVSSSCRQRPPGGRVLAGSSENSLADVPLTTGTKQDFLSRKTKHQSFLLFA